jgi:uncharacterized membrane protein
VPAGHGGLSGGRFNIPVGIALIGAGPVLLSRMAPDTGAAWLIVAVVVTQVTALVWLLTGRLAIWGRVILIFAALAGIAAATSLQQVPVRSLGMAMASICHVAAYSWLLIWFARSLRPGQEPLVTRFARRIRSTMPDKVIGYTRRVTIAWCIFFATQLVLFAALLAGSSEASLATFVNLLNLPMVMAMILAEFGCRLLIFRDEPRTGLIATLAGMRHIRGMPGSGT